MAVCVGDVAGSGESSQELELELVRNRGVHRLQPCSARLSLNAALNAALLPSYVMEPSKNFSADSAAAHCASRCSLRHWMRSGHRFGGLSEGPWRAVASYSAPAGC